MEHAVRQVGQPAPRGLALKLDLAQAGGTYLRMQLQLRRLWQRGSRPYAGGAVGVTARGERDGGSLDLPTDLAPQGNLEIEHPFPGKK